MTNPDVQEKWTWKDVKDANKKCLQSIKNWRSYRDMEHPSSDYYCDVCGFSPEAFERIVDKEIKSQRTAAKREVLEALKDLFTTAKEDRPVNRVDVSPDGKNTSWLDYTVTKKDLISFIDQLSASLSDREEVHGV